jgi:hypothetical protein
MLIKILKGARLKAHGFLLDKEYSKCGNSGPRLRAGVRIPFLTNYFFQQFIIIYSKQNRTETEHGVVALDSRPAPGS